MSTAASISWAAVEVLPLSGAWRNAGALPPFPFAGTARAAIGRLTAIVRSLPWTSVVVAKETYLHAGFRSAVFRFVDDVEFLADEPAGVIQSAPPRASAPRTSASAAGGSRPRRECRGESPSR